jgi:hypothetical protein
LSFVAQKRQSLGSKRGRGRGREEEEEEEEEEQEEEEEEEEEGSETEERGRNMRKEGGGKRMKWVPMVLISVAGFPPLRSPPFVPPPFVPWQGPSFCTPCT